MSSDTIESIFTLRSNPRNLYVSGNLLVWEDFRNGNMDIYGYDLAEDVEFVIASEPWDETSPLIDGTSVVWQEKPPNLGGMTIVKGVNLLPVPGGSAIKSGIYSASPSPESINTDPPTPTLEPTPTPRPTPYRLGTAHIREGQEPR